MHGETAGEAVGEATEEAKLVAIRPMMQGRTCKKCEEWKEGSTEPRGVRRRRECEIGEALRGEGFRRVQRARSQY